MTDARLMMIRHWHLRNGHKPRDGQDYCEGCAYEMDDLIKHMAAAGFAIVPKEPTEKMISAGEHDRMYVTSGPDTVWRAMVEASQCDKQ